MWIAGDLYASQTLELTALQFRILEAITPQKIKDASLLDIIKAFYILKKAELGLKGEERKITGLVAYLVQMEKEKKREKECRDPSQPIPE